MSATAQPNEGYVKTYTLANDYEGERDRLAKVEASWDWWSHQHFERLGVAEGWHVLMVAGGGGSLVEWICDRVGESGRVVATDLDPRFLRPLADRYPQLEVREHNVVTEELPTEEFDLAHTRLLVAWLPEREEVIRKMAGALKPGGKLMIEDFDSLSFGAAYPTELTEKVKMANAQFLLSNGYDPFTGRRLAGWLRDAGLSDVDSIGTTLSFTGSKGNQLKPMYLEILLQQKERMLEAGLLTEEDIAALAERYGDPGYDGLGHTMMTATGTRPA